MTVLLVEGCLREKIKVTRDKFRFVAQNRTEPYSDPSLSTLPQWFRHCGVIKKAFSSVGVNHFAIFWSLEFPEVDSLSMFYPCIVWSIWLSKLDKD